MRVITIGGLSLTLLVLPLLSSAAPVSGTWSATGSLSIGRYAATAVVLPSGKVLLAGGVDSGQVLAVGGLSNSITALSTAELYAP